ncbi:MAG: hypothetical protein PHX14_06825 [Syntrophomonadaceae bacterium]|nr:hypothetical protein [Syntrophomonadaceae bacterium]
MKYKFSGTKRDYPKQHIISRMTNFIIDNVFYFNALSHILIRVKNERRFPIIDEIIEREYKSHSKIMDEKNNSEFKKLVIEFLTEDFNKDGNLRGKLLEFIISQIGPINNINSNTLSILVDCRVLENDIPIGEDKNFDICFYCDYKCIEELQAELIESKLDINNFLFKEPYSPNTSEVTSRAKEKLEYMKEVFIKLSNSRHLIIALATIKYDIEPSRQTIVKLGFDNIVKIYDYNFLEKALIMKCSA